MNSDRKLVITQGLAQKIFEYLALQPFGEVFQLVNELNALQPLEEGDGGEEEE